MHAHRHRDQREHLWSGFLLLALGTVFLLDRFDVLDIGRLWTWWGLLPVAVGLVRAATWSSARSVASGVSWMVFGFWFLTSAQGWFGLDWGNSWPLALVGIGASIVVRALLEPVFARRQPHAPVTGVDPHV